MIFSVLMTILFFVIVIWYAVYAILDGIHYHEEMKAKQEAKEGDE